MRRPGRRNRALLILSASGSVVACEPPVAPAACDPPVVLQSSVASNPANVISALVTADLTNSDSVAVKFGRTGEIMNEIAPSSEASSAPIAIPVLGLHEATSYNLQVVAYNECGTTTGDLLSFTTESLPADLPRYAATGSDPSPGYVVFAAGRYGIAIDNTGRVAWYHRFPNGPGLNFQPQPNGRYVARPSPGQSEAARWAEIDPIGNVTRTLGCGRGLPARLHDMIALPDNSFWILCDEARAVDLTSSGGSSRAIVLGTVVQHMGPAGEILFDWSAFDHLEIDREVLESVDISGGQINWTHGNAIDIDTDGNVIVSFRNLSEVTKIDARTGSVIWRLGGIRNQFTFENAAAPAFVRQHGVRSAGAGRIRLLDNLGDPLASRAELYEYDERLRTVRQSSSYASSAGVVAELGGTTQALPNGRALVSFGNGGSVEETDASGRVVWKMSGNPGYVFRAQRISSLYHPGRGDSR